MVKKENKNQITFEDLNLCINKKDFYDVLVVGGGHAGSEAASSCARLKHKTLMCVLNKNMIANMPCNPSIGGSAKGIVVREIDALGGIMGKIADKHYMQMKVLNLSKGPGVQSLRAQEDKMTYPHAIREELEKTKNLEIVEKEVVDIQRLYENDSDKTLFKVVFKDKSFVYSKTVILATGTFLESTILRGFKVVSGGPDGEQPSHGLSDSLKRLGLNIFRLKTGTPPRIKKDSIDYSVLEEQLGTPGDYAFSYETNKFLPIEKQCKCYLTYTNSNTHNLINKNLSKSSMYGGVVTGVGPRYCPSIEDKIVRFADKERHLLFLEPESFSNDSIYLQGFSTSMPEEVQVDMVKSLKGLENAVILKYAYAIEYDAIRPLEFNQFLMSYKVKGLFGAGQVIGTSGYEEAASLGLMAGINASLFIENKTPFVLRRDEAYIGIMIDDLVTKGSDEPYRLLSSRNEYRLISRSDNADMRLTEYGYKLGLISKSRYNMFKDKYHRIDEAISILKQKFVNKNNDLIKYIISLGFEEPHMSTSYYSLLKRQFVSYKKLSEFTDLLPLSDQEIFSLEINLKYEGYIKMAYDQAEKLKKLEDYKIPEDIDYKNIDGISLEAREKLDKIKPKTIGLASRIVSVHPADIDTLLFYIKHKYGRIE